MSSRRVLLFGATGTIGRATARALLEREHEVVCFVRPHTHAGADRSKSFAGLSDLIIRQGDVSDVASISRDAFGGEQFDAIVSCLASRTGTPRDAWAIDHLAHLNILEAAKIAGVKQMVLLSAICVQKPLLAFQQAKLAFERALISSGLTWSIVRPTAFFKSLSGQIERVKRGQPFLVFGDGTLTSCKPISNADLAHYLVDCVEQSALHNRVLPIGGPGAALTPREQGMQLFALLGREPKFKQVPVALLDAIVGTLSVLGKVVPSLEDKAQLARIGRYYATESMLVWDDAAKCYDAGATPSTGTETLGDHYAGLLHGEISDDRGEHAVFSRKK